jgi:rare lipoprotein A
MRTRWLAVVIFALGVLDSGCARRHPRIATLPRPLPAPPPMTPAEIEAIDGTTGVASWYGVPYDGRPAADGEIYHMEDLVAAHRTLPFGTMLRVTNLSNNASVDVRIIDRGPFVDGRIIDLSKGAARRIAMIGPGTARVRLKLLSAPTNTGPSLFAVQIGAFADKRNAEAIEARLGSRYGPVRLVLRSGDPQLWRVLVGETETTTAAQELAARLRGETGASFVVSLEGVAGIAAENSR